MSKSAVAKTLHKIRIRMIALSLIGIALSIYALYVEVKKESDSDYQAMCDINSYISCSKVFTSKYGRGFGIVGKYLGEDHILNQPNSIPGIMFYILIIGLGEMKSMTTAKIQRTLLFLSNFLSLYLAYLLYFVLHDLCVICVSTYIVNFLLTLCSFHLVSTRNKQVKKKTK